MAKTSWLPYTLVGAASAAAAALAVLGATALVPPATLSEAAEARSAAVTLTQFRDERIAAAEIEAAQPVAATLGISGTVTASECVPGAEIASGKIVASVSGRPVLGLHIDVPFYRDIGPGTEGPDVNALRAQLSAMKYEVAGEGAYAADLRAAILKLQSDLALENRDGVLHQEDILWLPDNSVRVQSCDALLGSQYSAGSTFITTAGTLQSLRVVFPTSQAPAPGERQVLFGNVSAPVAADGLVTDAKFLAEVSRSPDFAAAQSSSSPKPMSLKTALTSPLEVAKVPVSGVFGARGNAACVKSPDGTTHRVTTAGSSAGSVLATFENEVPKEILLGTAIGSTECQN
ncbi:hypothetical protein ACIQF8_09535 [Pseudarthrobacter sp. NPDC092184]|uniref:hypothetical protein n=1 Tax=unclassified Pseudarthrobacter TaxID=2647000 RepID=UPI00382A576F